MKDITNRLSRVEGQLVKVVDSIEKDEDCEKVVPQLLAVKGAVDAIVRMYLEKSLETCAASDRTENMKQIIKMLMKHT